MFPCLQCELFNVTLINIVSYLFQQVLTVKSGEEDYLDTSNLLKQASPYTQIKYEISEKVGNLSVFGYSKLFFRTIAFEMQIYQY